MEDVVFENIDVQLLSIDLGLKSLDTENFYSKAVFGFDEGAFFEIENKRYDER